MSCSFVARRPFIRLLKSDGACFNIGPLACCMVERTPPKRSDRNKNSRLHETTRDTRMMVGIKSAKCVSYFTKRRINTKTSGERCSCTPAWKQPRPRQQTLSVRKTNCHRSNPQMCFFFFFPISPCYLLTDLLTSFLSVTQHLSRRSPRCRPNLCA